MRYHWGLGVGHVYAYDQGVSNRIPQESTSEEGEHDPATGKNEDVHYSRDVLDGDENGKDECPDQAVDDDSHEESGSESVQSTDDDIDDYDTLDYQN